MQENYQELGEVVVLGSAMRSVICHLYDPTCSFTKTIIKIKRNFEVVNLEPSLKIYPNPTHGNLTIELSEKSGNIYITDINGRILDRLLVNDVEQIKTDIQKYPTGIYLVKYEYQPDKWLTGKVILEH